MLKTWVNYSRRRKIMNKVTRWDNVKWTKQDEQKFSVNALLLVDQEIPSCSNEKVCEFMANFLSNPYPIQVEVKVSNLILDKFDRPTLHFEVGMKNCEKLEHIEGVRKKLQEVLTEAVNLINDYGY